MTRLFGHLVSENVTMGGGFKIDFVKETFKVVLDEA